MIDYPSIIDMNLRQIMNHSTTIMDYEGWNRVVVHCRNVERIASQ